MKQPPYPPLESEKDIATRTRRNVFRFKLTLPEYARSEAPIHPLGLFLSGIQSTISSIAQNLRSTLGRRGVIPRKVLSFSELALLAVGGGSFEILVGSTESPPLFDELEAEATDAFEYLVNLLAAANNADKLQALLNEQPRIAGNLLAMLRAIEKHVDSLQVSWASPRPGRGGEAKMSGTSIAAAIAVIERKAPEKKIYFWSFGRLIGASIERKVFEFWSLEREGERYEGKVALEAMAAIDGAVLGQTYRAYMQHVITLRPTTGQEIEEFTLLALAAPGQPEIGPEVPQGLPEKSRLP